MKRRLALRRRLEDYYFFVLENGAINRSDMARIGEVSIRQSSADMKALQEDYPQLGLEYDTSRKQFIASMGKIQAPTLTAPKEG